MIRSSGSDISRTLDGKPVPCGDVRICSEHGRTMCAPTALGGGVPKAGRGTRPLRGGAGRFPVVADHLIGHGAKRFPEGLWPLRSAATMGQRPLRCWSDAYRTRDGGPVPCGVGRTRTEGGQIARATSLFGRVPSAGRGTRPLRAYRGRAHDVRPYGCQFSLTGWIR